MQREFVIALALWLGLCGAAYADGAIAVIVPKARAEQHLDFNELTLIFQRKRQYWPDGARVQPVNLGADDPSRLAFSRAVLGADPPALESYWNEQYFRGIRPPYVVASHAAMLRFIADTPGAIGYLGVCEVTDDVALIGWLDAAGHWHRGRPTGSC